MTAARESPVKPGLSVTLWFNAHELRRGRWQPPPRAASATLFGTQDELRLAGAAEAGQSFDVRFVPRGGVTAGEPCQVDPPGETVFQGHRCDRVAHELVLMLLS